MKRYYSTKENWVNVEFFKFGWKFRIKILICHLHIFYWYFAIFQNHTFILTSSRLSSTLEYSQRYPAFAWSNCICKNVHISTTTVHMATKLGGVVNYHKGLLFIKLQDSDHVVSSRSHGKLKPLYLHYDTWLVAYLKRLLPTKSHDSWNLWSRDIIWQIKKISPLS